MKKKKKKNSFGFFGVLKSATKSLCFASFPFFVFEIFQFILHALFYARYKKKILRTFIYLFAFFFVIYLDFNLEFCPNKTN